MVYSLGCNESTESNWDTFRHLGQWRLIHGQLCAKYNQCNFTWKGCLLSDAGTIHDLTQITEVPWSFEIWLCFVQCCLRNFVFFL
jgi:hypothetical protein